MASVCECVCLFFSHPSRMGAGFVFIRGFSPRSEGKANERVRFSAEAMVRAAEKSGLYEGIR